jgi:hypothetical protein
MIEAGNDTASDRYDANDTDGDAQRFAEHDEQRRGNAGALVAAVVRVAV